MELSLKRESKIVEENTQSDSMLVIKNYLKALLHLRLLKALLHFP